jgi:nucleolar protein 8
MSDPQVKRLFIGNISTQLYATPEDLKARISRFGELKSEFELHFNDVKQLGFGYIEVELNDKAFAKLKSTLHGLKYKGSNLVIDEAKPNYKQRWERDAQRSNVEKQARMIRTEWEFYKKLSNIQKSLKDRQEIIPGRLRKVLRKDLKHTTLRVNFNGTVKVVKCYKKKLWGYEKNKKLRDLVYRYQNNLWKDGNDHIVERVSQLKIKQGDNQLTIQQLNVRDDDRLLKEFGDEEEEEMELEKNSKVLASILGNFDFDKPLEINEEVDEFGGSDYEYNKSDLEVDEDDFRLKPADVSQIEYVKEGEFGKDIPKAVHYDEDDDDDDDEAMDQDEDLNFIPTFGQQEEQVKEVHSTLVEGTVSNTETLRTLFNEDRGASFNLIEVSDEDIDRSKQPIQVEIERPEQPIASIAPKVKHSKGLFFAHLDSPFLVAQTQLNKLNTNVDFSEWDKEFWEKRGEWTTEFKRRKRDVLRQMRKKNAKNSRVLV